MAEDPKVKIESVKFAVPIRDPNTSSGVKNLFQSKYYTISCNAQAVIVSKGDRIYYSPWYNVADYTLVK